MTRMPAVTSLAIVSMMAGGLLAPAFAEDPTTMSPAPEPAPGMVGPAARYEDPVGDVAGGTGPDIVAVTVGQPDASLVSIGVEMASDPPLTYDLETMSTDMLYIGLSADVDGPETSDWVLGVHGATLPVEVETGSHMYVAARPEGDQLLEGVVDVAVDGPTVTLTFERALLGDLDQLGFFVAAFVEGSEEPEEGTEPVYDVCPDEEGLPGVYTFATEDA